MLLDIVMREVAVCKSCLLMCLQPIDCSWLSISGVPEHRVQYDLLLEGPMCCGVNGGYILAVQGRQPFAAAQEVVTYLWMPQGMLTSASEPNLAAEDFPVPEGSSSTAAVTAGQWAGRLGAQRGNLREEDFPALPGMYHDYGSMY